MEIYKLCFSLIFTITYLTCKSTANANYNILHYGAKTDGKTDSIKAFQTVWEVVCASSEPSIISVPKGRFFLSTMTFDGAKCKSKSITFQIDGTLVASSNYNLANWIKFHQVSGVSIVGGTLDAQGAALWACKNSGKKCLDGATALAFYHSNNIAVSGLNFLNSQKFNFLIYGSQNAKLQGVSISAPGNSPNTDGIHIQLSSSITIVNSHISTGDDCISIGPGTSNLWIEGINCGPGHGISIGSLGWAPQEAGVQNVTVRNTKFTGTQNGFRIKTWARQSNSFVNNVVFNGAVMSNVQNSIIIDQYYCPHSKNCLNESSGVKINNIKFQDIHGTSSTAVAIKLDCSKMKPCTVITLEDVNLTYNGRQAQASCANARGISAGSVRPISCLT